MSSSSKFFTWHPTRTKNPHYSSGSEKSPIVPKRKPSPLDTATRDPRSSRTTDSIALQDAAVQSATSLLAVMNDCLNTHLLTTQSASLQPGVHGRPRSRTAPSTPMAEAPDPPIAELEGSSPFRSNHAAKQSLDSSSMRGILESPTSSYRISITRPHSSPRDSQHKTPVRSRKSYERTKWGPATSPPADPTPRSRDSSPCQQVRTDTTLLANASDDTLVATESGGVPSSGKMTAAYRPSSAERQITSDACPDQAHPGRTTRGFPNEHDHPRRSISPEGYNLYTTLEDTLMEQIANMRASHDAHIAALKETHEREIASYRSYTSILEQQTFRMKTVRTMPRKTLTIDTEAAGRGGGLLSSSASATTSLSFELSQSQKRASSEAAAETESLKRKLSLARRTTAEIGDVRRERDQLKETNERNERRIAQLKEIIRKHKVNEKLLKNTIGSHESALIAANDQRLDALEGFYEACEQVSRASQREKFLAKELDDIQSLLSHIDPKWVKAQPPNQSSHAQEALIKRRRTLRQDPLLQQLDELRQTAIEKDLRIHELEKTSQSADQAQVLLQNHADVKDELDRMRQRAVDAEATRDKYNSLMHAELRRQSRSAAQKNHAMTPQLEGQASAAVAQRMHELLVPSGEERKIEATEGVETELGIMEKELKHCMQEIILYKLDIKGYKKDLRHANAEVEALKRTAQQPKAIDEQSNPTGVVAHQTDDALRNTPLPPPPPSSGLGILWPALLGPEKAIRTATAQALLTSAPTPQLTCAPLTSPRHPKTPLGTDKELPQPPPCSNSDAVPTSSPILEVKRQETLRSLSDSIISSYAKRTPVQGFSKTPPRVRSSEPPRTSTFVSDAISVPVSRYTSEMLKTPTRPVAMAHY